MTDAQVIGTLVIASSSIISLFSMVYKPLSENTKAMTTLGVKMEHLAEKIENEHNEHVRHIQEFEEYKEREREINQKQWDKLEEHGNKLIKHEQQIKHLGGS